MSSESQNGSEAGDDDVSVLAPKVSTEPRVHSVGSILGGGDVDRYSLGSLDNIRESLWMEQYGGERNLFSALGYITDPRYEHYRSRYERTDTAPALVDKIPKKAWAKPKVVDPGAEGEESAFEKQINAFLAGEFTQENPIEVFERATRMERLGNYSIILVGLNDAGASPDENELDDEQEAVELLQNPVDEGSLSEVQDAEEVIEHLSPYDQERVDWDGIEWATDDPTDSRFGKPEFYHIDLGDNRPDARVHWTRVIHVVGDVYDNDWRSPSVLKQSLNRIDDIEKILGGSAEGYWRSAYQGLVISPPEIDNEIAKFSDSGEELHSQINRYINNFSREIFTAADVDPINVDAQDPSGFLDSQYKSLAAGHDLPQSILMGNETGERATEEDRAMLHERISEFREEYCEAVVLKKFINRMIRFGVFAQPTNGRYAYDIRWPPISELTEAEEWNISQTKSNSIATATGGNPLLVATPEEIRQEVFDWKPERGAMVEGEAADIEPATAEDLETDDREPERLEVDENDERVQQQFEDMTGIDVEELKDALEFRLNQEFDVEEIRELVDKDELTEDEVEKLRVETEDGLRGFVVDVLTSGFDVEEATVEASEEEPKFIVVTESSDKPWGDYTADELRQVQWDSGVDSPEEDLAEEEEDRENSGRIIRRAVLKAMGRTQQEGHFTWPESWRESDKPARLIAIDAWLSMGARHGGGSPGGCTSTMRGKIADPDRFCADFKDRIYMWDYWRGDSWAPGD